VELLLTLNKWGQMHLQAALEPTIKLATEISVDDSNTTVLFVCVRPCVKPGTAGKNHVRTSAVCVVRLLPQLP
jgi:hypothetical protein